MATAPERTKLRRWALEMLVPTASLETDTDIVHLCRTANFLVEFALTGAMPAIPEPSPENGDGRDGLGSTESRPN